MEKTALITGATDGIGKATAIALAKKDYTIHVLGIDKKRGEETLSTLNELNPNGKHKLFITDLSDLKQIDTFIHEYTQQYQSLDVLLLNAGIFQNKPTLSKSGIDLAFAIGYVSRYIFSVKLNPLLAKSRIGKVIHVNGSVVGEIKFNQLTNPKYNSMTSVWQNSVGSALLAYHWQSISSSKVAHMHWNPSIVNTQTVKSQSSIVRFLSKLAGMIEPEKAGQMLADNIDQTPRSESTGAFYVKGKKKKAKKSIANGTARLKELLQFSKKFTGIDIKESMN
ncbi:SDR family NAD(P)-dependent oxidoreductase [Aureibacter tunicatorum]|uniref:NAD(P)-dependent dehydrogenase (Short-subunit alcohol dehydrogenase family) n=1 Tax=Aureibacter tunicatorum TaxID=866807 RepID=A0AAE4BV16_9BACT|nr:SDR family NAD(P)-dependent oxidoreductase [Aureibacter tunicatorum]MDR6241407.1 NAD(P)-dependent dehydrogenase (short-subunit alcohol dehydrogenase family) [Aureibacter tunicatorum]BDD06748.1 hypothetical protein AUTU_42310 [Aureibacter tunicatorum]